MKKIKLLFTLFLWITISVQAQVPPNAFNYSAVARDASGEPIATTTIGVQVSILQSSTIGSAIYVENHFVNTDDFGLFNLIIGAGAAQTGTMENIAWDTDDFYLQIGMDANGGTNFLTMGTTQLLSVPYALHAATADSLIGGGPSFSGDYNDLSNQPITVDSISANNDTIYLSNGESLPLMTGNMNNGLDIPALVTSIGSIGSNSATLSGEISNLTDPSAIVELGFTFSTTPHPTYQNNAHIIVNSLSPPIAGEEVQNFNYNPLVGFEEWQDSSSSYFGSGCNWDGVGISSGQGVFNPSTSYYFRTYIIMESNIVIYGNEINFTTTTLGQTGPAGGIVVFDLGHDDLGWQYLEISPTPVYEPGPVNTAYPVPVWGPTILLGTSHEIGAGPDNTALMMANAGLIELPTSCAGVQPQYYDGSHFAGLVDTYSVNGFNDWFLPSSKEGALAFLNDIANMPNSLATSSEWGNDNFVIVKGGAQPSSTNTKDRLCEGDSVEGCPFGGYGYARPLYAFRRY